VTTFNVTFRYLGRDWFLRAKSWTEWWMHASHYDSEEAAIAALAIARRSMRNKQAGARIIKAAPIGPILPAVSQAQRTGRIVFDMACRHPQAAAE